jgi:hypothetical protein
MFYKQEHLTSLDKLELYEGEQTAHDISDCGCPERSDLRASGSIYDHC